MLRSQALENTVTVHKAHHRLQKQTGSSPRTRPARSVTVADTIPGSMGSHASGDASDGPVSPASQRTPATS
jgi:hypothetical protein